MVRATRTNARECGTVRESSRFDGARHSRTRPHAEGFGGLHVLRSRRAGGILPVQFPGAPCIHTFVARGFAGNAQRFGFSRKKSRPVSGLPPRGLFRGGKDSEGPPL